MKDIVEILVDLKDRVWKNDRVEELSQLAQEQNFQFSKREKFAEQDYKIKEFRLFKNKKGIRFKGILSYSDPEKGFNGRIYDYFGFVDGEETKTTVVELFHPEIRLQKFEICPKRTIRWAKEIIIRESPLFKDLERFNAFYEIRTDFPQKAQRDLNEFALDMISNKKNIRLEGDGNYIVAYYRNKQIPVRNIMEEHQFLVDVATLLLDPPSEEGYV